MQKFTFYSPTKVVFGKDAELSTAEEIKKAGGSRVMIVYGGGSAVKSGLLDRVRLQLDREGIPYTAFGGVKSNPFLSVVRAGVEQAAGFKADFILGVGGGSAIDTAKAIAIGVANPQTNICRYWTKEETVEKALPVGAVLTISASGSETSDSAVLTDDETGSKRGLSTEFNRPKFAIMNPELTYTLPKYQVMCGVVDIMMHTLDRYFTPVTGNELTDGIAETVLRVAVKNGEIAMKNPCDYQAMSELMWCASISHNGLTGLGGANDFAPHQLAHEISAKFDSAHGASLSAIWDSWARYCCDANPERFAQYAKNVWGIDKGGVEETALAGIDKTVSYFVSIEAPTCFTELGIGVQSEETLKELAERCMYYGRRKIGQFKVLDREDAYRIYKLANR